MKIYIASSWRNCHGVQMLTDILRKEGHIVVSWIENCNLEANRTFNFEDWIKTDPAQRCFEFDTDGAMLSNLLIYYGPAGKDACAELGAAWASGVECIGLYAKGEDLGLMRKMCRIWFDEIGPLMDSVREFQKILDLAKSYLL